MLLSAAAAVLSSYGWLLLKLQAAVRMQEVRAVAAVTMLLLC
jgi:hypothetical protein